MKIEIKFDTIFTDNHIDTSVNEDDLLLKALKRLCNNDRISGSTYVTKNRLEDAAKKHISGIVGKSDFKLHPGSEDEITSTLSLKAVHVDYDLAGEDCIYQVFNKVYVKGVLRRHSEFDFSYRIFHLVVSERGNAKECNIPEKLIVSMPDSRFKNGLLMWYEMNN